MEEFIEFLAGTTGVTLIIIMILISVQVLNWILYIILTSDVSTINKRLKETNKLLLAMINEQRRVNEYNPQYLRQEGQAQQMDSIEPPKL